MRIALLTEVFLPKYDGVVKSICHLLDYLEEHGHESLMLAPEGSPEQYAATPIIQMKSHHLTFYPEFRLVSPAQKIPPELDDFMPDIIHLINPFSLGLIGAKYARKHNIPLVASYQTDLPGYLERWGASFLSQPVERYLYWLHQQAQLNLAPSRVTQEELINKGYQNVRLWTRGIESDLFHPNLSTRQMRNYLSDSHSHSPLLLYVGRLSREKRVEMLKPVLDAIPNARLAIVGDGPYRKNLENIFKNTPAKFTGYLFGEELAKAYASADIFVFTGANETFGNVVLEAMASGLPVIAPDSGGVMDMVKPYETGLLFETESQDSLVNAVQQLVDSRDLLDGMRVAARKLALSFSWEDILNQLLADYQDLIDNYQPNVPEAEKQPFAQIFQTFR